MTEILQRVSLKSGNASILQKLKKASIISLVLQNNKLYKTMIVQLSLLTSPISVI